MPNKRSVHIPAHILKSEESQNYPPKLFPLLYLPHTWGPSAQSVKLILGLNLCSYYALLLFLVTLLISTWSSDVERQHYLPSSNSRVTEGSTYSHQCFPSVDTGISQLDHLQAKWMHTHAITVGLYWRQNVVRWRLLHKFHNEEPKEIKHVK